jgi:hypothetical protein
MHARVLSWVSHRCGRLFGGYSRLFSCALKEQQHATQRLDWVQSRTRRVWFLQGDACLAWMGCDISAPKCLSHAGMHPPALDPRITSHVVILQISPPIDRRHSCAWRGYARAPPTISQLPTPACPFSLRCVVCSFCKHVCCHTTETLTNLSRACCARDA